MNPYSELLLRCSTLATAADIKGPLGQDIICKMIIDKGVGNIMQTRTDEGHFVKLHGPITLRTLRFKCRKYPRDQRFLCDFLGLRPIK